MGGKMKLRSWLVMLVSDALAETSSAAAFRIQIKKGATRGRSYAAGRNGQDLQGGTSGRDPLEHADPAGCLSAVG